MQQVLNNSFNIYLDLLELEQIKMPNKLVDLIEERNGRLSTFECQWSFTGRNNGKTRLEDRT